MKRMWLVCATVYASMNWATSARADAVTYWNTQAVLRRGGRSGGSADPARHPFSVR
jgi:hypothetical protein